MGAIGIRHLYLFRDNKTYIRTVALVNAEQNLFKRDSLDNASRFIRTYEEQIQYNTIRISTMLNHKWNKKNMMRTGIILSNMNFNLEAGYLLFRSGQFINLFKNAGNTGLIQSYLQWKFLASDNLELIGGFHSMHFLINNETTIEPRLGIRWKYAGNQSLSLGWGLHSRIEPLSMYYYRSYKSDGTFQTPNKSLRSTKSFHNVAGYSVLFREHYMIKGLLPSQR